MKSKLSLLFLLIVLFSACQQNNSVEGPAVKKGMVKVTILYPNSEGKTFDMDYYSTKHMPMIGTLLGDSLKLIKIDKGIAAGAPDTPVPYLAIGYLYFESVSAFKNSFGPHAEKIRGDVKNYTNIQPVVLISEVLQ
ncbi:MAG: EthD family reductase [Cyclobacteriaceae bacterium]|nr:EthD family reductase [Cyclobacteriaceae bacterium]